MAAPSATGLNDAVAFLRYERAASTALQAWAIGVARLRPVSIQENIVLRVEANDGRRYALRLHRPGYHSLSALQGEQTWTRALVAAGINAPVAVPARSGAGHSQVEVAGEQRYASLVPWVDGATLDASDGEDLGARFAKLGAIMAGIHGHAASWPVPKRFVRHAFDADGLMGPRPFWGRFWESPYLRADQRRRCEALRRRLHGYLTRLPKRTWDYSLIHADMHPGNVVETDQGLHVIDFDDAGFGWHCYDFAAALSHHRSHPDLGRLRDALFAGYRRLRRLPPDAAALLPMFLLVRCLASVGWFADRPELDPGKATAELMAFVEAGAERTCRSLGI